MNVPWKTYEPFTTPTVEHPLLRDIQSRLSPREFDYYCGFDDLVTRVHEGMHGLHARIRNMEGSQVVDAFYERDFRYPNRRRLSQIGRDVLTHRGCAEWRASGRIRVNAFYCLDGHYVLFNEPRFHKSQIARFVPRDFQRHHLFETYITGARDWEGRPLYVFDEATAYNIGAETGESESEIEFATIFLFFCQALIECCNEHDPGYKPELVLGPFVAGHANRLDRIIEQHGEPKHRSLLDRFLDQSYLF